MEYTNAIWDEYAGAENKSESHTDVWRRLLHPADLESYTARWQEALESGGMF